MEHLTTDDNLALLKYGKQSINSQKNLEKLQNWVAKGKFIWVQILAPLFPVMLTLDKWPSLQAIVTGNFT